MKGYSMKDRTPSTCIKCGKIEWYGKAENINPSTFECSDCQSDWLWSIGTDLKEDNK